MRVPISHCKLSKKIQKQLLQFFAAEVTARTASDSLGINRRTATLYYQKIRAVIYDHLKQEAGSRKQRHILKEKSNGMSRISAVGVKGSEAVGLLEK